MESPEIPRFTIQNNPSLSSFSQKCGKISFDEKANNNSFQNFSANLALNLVNKLPHVTYKFNLDSVLAYYKRFLNTENQKFTFSPTPEDEILKLLNRYQPRKSSRYRQFIQEVFKRWCSCFSFTNIKTM